MLQYKAEHFWYFEYFPALCGHMPYPHYIIAKIFSFLRAYNYLSKDTDLIACSASDAYVMRSSETYLALGAGTNITGSGGDDAVAQPIAAATMVI